MLFCEVLGACLWRGGGGDHTDQAAEQHGDGVGDGGVVQHGLVLAAGDRQVHHG